ncbi:MAG TPA: murein L,D-transpeptidase catalytic domain family protein [Dokdonella sp.]
MRRFPSRAARLSCALLLALAPAARALHAREAAPARLADALAAAAPSADRKVIELATRALACVRPSGERALGVIDYSKPSTEPRLWVFDLAEKKLLFQEWVAHGRNSGGNLAERFSNAPGSLMSSLGAFETAGTYVGHNGYSLRLRGLEPGFNDNAYERAIVIHGATYVGDGLIRSQGRLGRSFGCPAVRPAIAHRLIDTLADRAFVFAYYPDRDWLSNSQLLGDCAGSTTASRASAPADVRLAAGTGRVDARTAHRD